MFEANYIRKNILEEGIMDFWSRLGTLRVSLPVKMKNDMEPPSHNMAITKEIKDHLE